MFKWIKDWWREDQQATLAGYRAELKAIQDIVNLTGTINGYHMDKICRLQKEIAILEEKLR